MRRSSKIHQILHLIDIAYLNPHSPKILHTKFRWNRFSSFGEEVI